MTTSFQDTVKRLQSSMDEARKEAKKAFLAELKTIFTTNPEITILKWTQYTPYFNDGDTCEFRVNELVGTNNEDVSYWGEWDGDEEDEPADLIMYGGYGGTEYKSADLDALASFMGSSLGHDVLQFAFGDHVAVTVTANGVEIDHYDHD